MKDGRLGARHNLSKLKVFKPISQWTSLSEEQIEANKETKKSESVRSVYGHPDEEFSVTIDHNHNGPHLSDE